MRKIHKIICGFLLMAVSTISYMLDWVITDSVSRNLVTFFSIVLGFYMTSIAILYGSSYAKKLYREVYDRENKRGIHVLRGYLLEGGYWAIFSITAIIIVTLYPQRNECGGTEFVLHIFGFDITPLVFGISAINIFIMLLLLRGILNGMIEEAKSSEKHGP